MPDGGGFSQFEKARKGHTSKGRGAVSNDTPRFERLVTEAFDDGWGSLTEDMPSLRTTLTREVAFADGELAALRLNVAGLNITAQHRASQVLAGWYSFGELLIRRNVVLHAGQRIVDGRLAGRSKVALQGATLGEIEAYPVHEPRTSAD